LANVQSFEDISRLLLLRCPAVGPFLARDLIRNAFRDIVELRQWSWLLKRSQMTVPNEYNTGHADVVYGSDTVTITTGVVDPIHIGRQFRTGLASPILTITDVDTVLNTYTLNEIWTGTSGTNLGYSVYQAYQSVPTDFHSFISMVDPATYWSIQTSGITLEMLDNRDPQRSIAGTPPRVIVPFDYYLGNPRFELWPHQRTQSFYLMTYESRPLDPFSPGAEIPTMIPGDVILERALMYTARWPGSSPSNRNMYYSERNAAFHEEQYDRRIGILMKQDNEMFQRDITYQNDQNISLRNVNAAYMQMHDMAG